MNRKEKALEFVNAEYDIHITGRHIQITEGMKAHAMDKLSKIERIIDRISDINVIMDIQKINHIVEIVLKAGAFKITSKASSTDMYVSIDQAVDKLEAQILRYKSKIQDYHAKARGNNEMTVNILSPLEIEEEFNVEEDTRQLVNHFKPHQIVKQETRSLKTLTVEEAMVKMELSGDPFLIFKNEADQKLKVIYRRKDENYGIIEPSTQ